VAEGPKARQWIAPRTGTVLFEGRLCGMSMTPRFAAILLSLVLALFTPGRAAAPPTIQLARGALALEVALPDAETGFYRGPRFDWGSHIVRATYAGVEFFSPWKTGIAAGEADAGAGPAEEFDMKEPPGFADAGPGGEFLKIGVGILRREDERPYFFNRRYALVRSAPWRITRKTDSITLRQEVHLNEDRAYALEREIALLPSGDGFTLRRTLTNLGRRPLLTEHYAHNFLRPGGTGLRPETGLAFSFPVRLAAGRANAWQVDGSQLSLVRLIAPGDAVFASLAEIPDKMPSPWLTITAQGLRFRWTGSRPPEAIAVYGRAEVVCPEFFVRLVVEPGESVTWSDTWSLELLAPRDQSGRPDAHQGGGAPR
jgi:hypothetical protein